VSPHPDWIPVDSTAISAVAYNNGTLFIRWIEGNPYTYSIVPEHKFEELMTSDSIGEYVNREIKPHYHCRKL
jgi:hypothetical protein